jgi:hypothetical protein
VASHRWYDAVFNNERQSVESIAEACLRIVECGWPNQGRFPGDADHPGLAKSS